MLILVTMRWDDMKKKKKTNEKNHTRKENIKRVSHGHGQGTNSIILYYIYVYEKTQWNIEETG